MIEECFVSSRRGKWVGSNPSDIDLMVLLYSLLFQNFLARLTTIRVRLAKFLFFFFSFFVSFCPFC